MTYARVVRSYAVLRDAVRAGKDSATWPRLSPGEARGITAALDDAVELYEALNGLIDFAESTEAKALVGDEGCLWPMEFARAALAKAGNQ